MNGQKEKIAVIGTGAAGLGVLAGLLSKKTDFNITVFDIGKETFKADLPEKPTTAEINFFYDQIYQTIRSENSFKFPPPKTHLGKQIPRQPVGEKLSIFKSESFGGLINYWGATMLPFTEREMAGWPITPADLRPYYQKISVLVGLSARPDNLNEYFSNDFASRPPAKPLPELAKLNEIINQQEEGGNSQFKIISGWNRCGLETRDGEPNSCIYCGECMAGCFRNGVFNGQKIIKRYLADPRVEYQKGKVKRVGQKGNLWEMEMDDGRQMGEFDKVFLSAGCPASTEIVLRSFNIKEELIMADNAVYVFPIFYFGRKLSKTNLKSYLSLANLLVGCLPKDSQEHFTQIMVYPNFDYLWRYNIPPLLWEIIRPLVVFSRAHIFWGRMFLHSDYSQAYSVKLADDQLVMAKQKEAGYADRLKVMMSALRRAVNHRGFYLPPVKPILQKVNSHYTSTLPFNNRILPVSKDGEIAPGFYLCDSATFPASPAMNPGFTIMANACRIADRAVGDLA
ncbi:MAG: hypothetical protein V1684_01435 [bacterium]